MTDRDNQSSAEPRSTDASISSDEDLIAALADDFAARVRGGKHPAIEEYVAKHPELGDRIRKLFPAIAAMEGARTVEAQPSAEPMGAPIGRYKLLERIGEGGFGVVYMAEQQQPVRRKVALKVIKPGMDSRQVLARFEAERQALAIMDHPNIAKVFDGGMTDSNRPYFVMELVKGVPITEFCDQQQLTPRQRLELFLQVCHAVQHAHQKGIIHRDLKPSNVLVAMNDTTPVVKVIDFGVAKALGGELTDMTLFTGFAQLVGTPLYMSPEQAGQSAIDVDTRSDIYSLGVLLYELLTGTTPFDKERFRTAAHDEIRRIIREEEPPKPSTRISSLQGQALVTASAQRKVDSRRLGQIVRGELDWIVMKAIEKDRNRRYETANGFALDVQRYLADEAVLACPPSVGYRLRKFARRNKGGLAVGALVLFFLVLLGSGVGWAVRDRAARQARVTGQVESIHAEVDQLEKEQKWPEALAAARRAEAAIAGGEADANTVQRVRQRLKDLEFIDRLEQIRMVFPMEGTLKGWEETERLYGQAFRDYGVDIDALAVETSVKRLKTRATLATALAAVLDNWVLVRAERAAFKKEAADWKRLVAIARGIDLEPLRDRLRSTWGRSDSGVKEELRRLAESVDVRGQHPATLYCLATSLVRAELPDSALRLLREAQSAYPGDYWFNHLLGVSLYHKKDLEGAIRFYTAAAAVRPSAFFMWRELAFALCEHGQTDQAITAFRRAIESGAKQYWGPQRPDLDIGHEVRAHGKLDQAIAFYRKAIEADPDEAAAYWGEIGYTLHHYQSKLDEALDAYHKAVKGKGEEAGGYWVDIGDILRVQKKADEAIDAYHKAIELKPNVPEYQRALGNALYDQEKLDQAVVCYNRAIELAPKYAGPYNDLGVVLYRQNKAAQAIACYEKAIELDPSYAAPHLNLGNALWGQKKLDDAIGHFRRAIELHSEDPRLLAGQYVNLGQALCEQKKPGEAIADFRKAIELDPNAVAAWFGLGNALHDQGKPHEAMKCYQKTIEIAPKFVSAHNNLGALLCNDLKQYDKAAESLRKAIELAPNNPGYHFNLGNALYGQRKFDEAIAAYRKTIALDPANSNAHPNLAFALNELAWALATDPAPARRDPTRAVDLAKEAVELTPRDAICWKTLGAAQYRSGNWKDATAALEKSMELRKGGDSNDWFLLAMARWRLGEKEKAREMYDRAVEWMDKNQPKDEALRRFRAEAAEVLELKEKKN